MGEIIESIINGQRKQALDQLYNSPFTLDELFTTLIELEQCQEIPRMFRIAVNENYITFGEYK